MIEPHYCELCGCVCVACAQLGGCDDCELMLAISDPCYGCDQASCFRCPNLYPSLNHFDFY